MASDCVLALNAGSSSVKFAVYADQPDVPVVLTGSVSDLGQAPRLKAIFARDGTSIDRRLGEAAMGASDALRHVFDVLRHAGLFGRIALVGHRIVHGGRAFVSPARLDPPALDALRRLIPLAPLHQPFSLAIVDAAMTALPHALHTACFDTAFHANQPRLARTYGLPRALSDDGIVSYGFHGLSYTYIVSRLVQRYGPEAGGRVIVAHLGSGSSLCALSDGRSIATTMGFSVLDGPPMGTRSGSIDPGVVLYLMQERGMSASDVSTLLYEQSGWLGISGVSADMAELAASANPHAREAIDLFVYRVGREIGSLAAAIAGLDGFVFTGGIGEHAAGIRQDICDRAAWLGLTIDRARNAAGSGVISADGAAVDVLAIPTDEELVLAEGARACRDAPVNR